MAWQETCVMDERLCFVSACLEGGDSISELCRVFGISRKTGHERLGRCQRDGVHHSTDDFMYVAFMLPRRPGPAGSRQMDRSVVDRDADVPSDACSPAPSGPYAR